MRLERVANRVLLAQQHRASESGLPGWEGKMPSRHLDTFKRDGSPDWDWLEVIADLQIASRHLRQLASDIPEECVDVDQRIHQIVADLIRLGSDRVKSCGTSFSGGRNEERFISPSVMCEISEAA